MRLIDILTAPWAIQPEKLREIQAIYATHLRGEKIDLEAIEARLGRPLANEQREYEVHAGGVALLQVSGVLAPKANLFMRVSGGVSTQMLERQVEAAIADARVRSLVLVVDSPGGSVLGAPELAATVRELAAIKPIVAVSDGQMASAAYWVGAAANAVFVTGPTVMVGSIGVVATHNYRPDQREVVTEITAGRYKRIATDAAPLTEEGRDYLQQQVDHLYSVFVDAVADHRGVDARTVLERMADGRVFIGQQAIDAGLVDGVSALGDLMEQLARDPAQFAARRKAVVSGAGPKSAGAGAAHEDAPIVTSEGTVMPEADNQALTRESLERDHAALYAQLRSQFLAEGAAAERARIADVRAQLLPGHEALIEKLAADGKTSGAEAAAQVLAAERGLRAQAAAAHAADAPQPAPASPAPAAPSARSKADQVAEARAYATEHKVDFVAALKALGHAA